MIDDFPASVVWQPPPDAASLSIEHDRIDVWRISIDPRVDESTLESRRTTLSPDEAARAGRFHTGELATRWLLGRSALRAILSRYVGIEPERLVLTTEAHGKPALDASATSLSHAVAPAFNLSHAGDLALLAVAGPMPLGIDIEPIRNVQRAQGITERFFSLAEREQFQRLAFEDREAGFLRCWTRKEAFIKAIGEGLSRPLASFDVAFAPDVPARMLRIGDDPAEAGEWWLHGFVPAPGYVAAVAARTRAASLTFLAFDSGSPSGVTR